MFVWGFFTKERVPMVTFTAETTSRNLEMSDLSLALMKTTFSNNQKNGRLSPSFGLNMVNMR